VLEAMLRSDIPSVESCLDLTLDELNTLCQSPQASIKSKATKVRTMSVLDCWVSPKALGFDLKLSVDLKGI